MEKGKTDALDAELGIETVEPVPLWRLDISSENAKFGTTYQTVAPTAFHDTIAAVPTERSSLTFLDLGCGKGRTLVLAARMGFARVIGVEFSAQLAAIARRNLLAVRARAEVVEADASGYDFPDAELLIYMYNPFGEPVLNSVCDNLVQWRQKYPKTAYVAYLNPLYAACFESRSEFELVAKTSDARVWRVR